MRTDQQQWPQVLIQQPKLQVGLWFANEIARIKPNHVLWRIRNLCAGELLIGTKPMIPADLELKGMPWLTKFDAITKLLTLLNAATLSEKKL